MLPLIFATRKRLLHETLSAKSGLLDLTKLVEEPLVVLKKKLSERLHCYIKIGTSCFREKEQKISRYAEIDFEMSLEA
jgi:hypothetical protein